MLPVYKKNQIVKIEITDINQDGNGVGRLGNGMVVFVQASATGDVVNVKLVKLLKNYAYGIIDSFVEPSSCRVENDCTHFSRCGGCSLRHISYDGEMMIKAGWVEENLRRIGHIYIGMDELIPSPLENRYRNKAMYPIRLVDGQARAGFFAARSHNIIPVEDCLLQPEFFSDIAKAFCEYLDMYEITPYNEEEHSGLVRTLYLRYAEKTDEIMVCVVINGSFFPDEDKLVKHLRECSPKISTILLNINRRRDNILLGDREQVLYGNGRITDVLGGIKACISPKSFYQVNRRAAELLYEKALEFASPKPTDTLVDLYCGAGTIGLSMSKHVSCVIGVEIIEDAVRDADKNAADNKINNARFICSDASGAVETLEKDGITPDIIVLDPPRKGVEASVLQCAARLSPEKIIYISCNSATLARDCMLLGTYGYSVKRAVAVDMFPRTAHVETVVLLSRKTPNDVIHVDLKLDELDLTSSESKATYE